MPTVAIDVNRDIHERFSYNAFGELSYSADGTGAVTAFVYDSNGKLTQKTLLANKAVPAQSLASVTASSFDRTERFSYDAEGRRVWHSDALGALDYTGYDAEGRVARTIQYGQVHPGALPTDSVALPTTLSDRVTATWYNAFGQVAYTVDALNRVTFNSHDQAGRVSSTTKYAGTLSAGTVPGAQTLPIDFVNDQTTSFVYDAMGRVKQRIDPMGGVQSTAYDGLGNKLTLTDEKNQVWTYAYDAAGRQLTQVSPTVSVTTNVVNGGGDLVDGSSSTSIVTQMTYDGVGNLVRRVDGYGREDARTTNYGYDAAGRRVVVQAPAFDSYDYQGNLTSTAAPVTRTFYDAFGNVVASVDPLSHITYAAYDQANRQAYAIDQLGYVIGSARNVFGDVISQTSYGAQTTLVGAVPTSAANAPTCTAVANAVAALPHGDDRIATFTYDGVGRLTSRVGMSGYFLDATMGFSGSEAEAAASPRMNFWYDAFGDVVLQEQLVNQDQRLYAQTYHYFDQAGQETDTVDAKGFQTHRSFDTFGNVTQTLEYATAKTGSWSMTNVGATPATSVNDRTSTDVYDRLNRRTSETRTLDYSFTDDGLITGHTVTSSWGYDAQGRVTRSTDETGVSKYHSYDALGQLQSTVEPARSSTVDGSSITPLTEYSYDAFGDLVLVAQRYNTATSVSEFTGVWTSGGAKGYTCVASANDRVTRTLFDAGGHAVQVDDPLAGATSFHNTINRYTASGQVVYITHLNAGNDGISYTVDQGWQYDAKGQAVLTTHSVRDCGSAARGHLEEQLQRLR